MFDWMKKKLKAGRIAMSITQLEHELQTLSPQDIGSVLVTAMHFCRSFADKGIDGALIARALEDPASLGEEDAYAVYWNLEGILMAGQKENDAAYTNTKARMGEKFAETFRKDMKIMEIGIRLLLSRIAVAADRQNKGKLSVVARRINDGRAHVAEATKKLRLAHSITGTPKGDDYYAGLETTARTYAFTYIASHGRAAQS